MRVLWLDEVGVDFGTEGGTECGDERCETLDWLVVEEEVDRACHRAAEGDVREDRPHHGFYNVAGERAALQ